jgi:hypothetical protein
MLALLLVAVASIARVRPGHHRTAHAHVRTRRDGHDLVRAGNARLVRIHERYHAAPSWPYRLTALAKLGYVPLLVAFWLA